MSYPAYRKKRIEFRLQYISDAADLQQSYAELEVLQKVLKENHSFCSECVFDCMECNWIKDTSLLMG
ncbi:MAG: hypothetical protein ACRC01_03455 [Deefgea sp.]